LAGSEGQNRHISDLLDIDIIATGPGDSGLRNHDAVVENDGLFARHNPAKHHDERIGAIGRRLSSLPGVAIASLFFSARAPEFVTRLRPRRGALDTEMRMRDSNGRNLRSGRLLGYWYVCIGIGFGLLGLRNLLAGAAPWTIALRWIVALGFFVLGAGSLGSGKPKSGSERGERPG